MRNLFFLFLFLAQSIAPAYGERSVEALPETQITSHDLIPLRQGTDLQRSFLSQEKVVFDITMAVSSHDPEEDHVWAAKRWVEALTSPAASEEDFISTLWVNGQQIAALQRQNNIYLRTKGSPRSASLVLEKEIERQLEKYCLRQEVPKECLATLKEKALRLSEIFWGDFKKAASEDFKKNKLNQNKIEFHQIRGHIRDAFRDTQSPAWAAINDYVEALKTSDSSPQVPAASRVPIPMAVPIVPAQAQIPHVNLYPTGGHKKEGIRSGLEKAKKRLGQKLGLIPEIEDVEEERKPWNYVDSKSQGYDLSRATSRYSEQLIRSLSCGHFEEASLLNGQIIARLLRNGGADVAQLSSMTSRQLESWCYSQFSRGAQIIECKNSLQGPIAELNRYYWQEIKSSLEKDKNSLSSADVDAYFVKLKSTNAAKNPSHPLGKIHAQISDTLARIKGDWDYTCIGDKDEALGDYRSIKAIEEAKKTADRLLSSLAKNSLRSPNGYCARSVKTAMQAAGIFRNYPGWGNATSMAKGFEYENLKHIHLKEGYELRRMDSIDPLEAPPYAFIVYGNGDGHVEQKIPTADLLQKGIKTMYAYGRKQINVADQEFAYVSDYIDSAPRNNPKSRTARGDGSNNGRPVLGVYVIMRKS